MRRLDEKKGRSGQATASSRQLALRFIIGIGVVSLFADFTYEGGRSISGPFLGVLGASPLLVGVVAGVGEFLGYALRLVSGRLVDRSQRHWPLIILGYAVNQLAVPLLALTYALTPAAALMFAERLGKGVRTPARDALLARASREVGRGYAFGLHEVLDQIGAVLGPLLVAGAVAWGGYRLGFGVLAAPAFLALLFLLRARGLEPEPPQAEAASAPTPFSRRYWRYLAFIATGVAGFAHFTLLAYHLEARQLVPSAAIPLLFALAMAVDAVAAFAVGRAYDRVGLRVLYALPLLTLPIAPLVFLSARLWAIALGVALWGAAMGLQESLMRAAVADLTPAARRGSAYGLFDFTYGSAWMLGSLAMGALYSSSPGYLVGFALLMQALSLVLLPWLVRSL